MLPRLISPFFFALQTPSVETQLNSMPFQHSSTKKSRLEFYSRQEKLMAGMNPQYASTSSATTDPSTNSKTKKKSKYRDLFPREYEIASHYIPTADSNPYSHWVVYHKDADFNSPKFKLLGIFSSIMCVGGLTLSSILWEHWKVYDDPTALISKYSSIWIRGGLCGFALLSGFGVLGFTRMFQNHQTLRISNLVLPRSLVQKYNLWSHLKDSSSSISKASNLSKDILKSSKSRINRRGGKINSIESIESNNHPSTSSSTIDPKDFYPIQHYDENDPFTPTDIIKIDYSGFFGSLNSYILNITGLTRNKTIEANFMRNQANAKNKTSLWDKIKGNAVKPQKSNKGFAGLNKNRLQEIYYLQPPNYTFPMVVNVSKNHDLVPVPSAILEIMEGQPISQESFNSIRHADITLEKKRKSSKE